jgi:hypothetical protein
MSDVTAGSLFNPQFFMNPPWWLGRVEQKETWSDNIQGETFTNVTGIKGWGHRYKVRVFNWHTGELDKLPPKDMAYCQVVMPVTAGSGHGGATETPSIESGSVVFGFFMDGMAGQEGYIMGVIGNSNNNVPRVRGESAPNQPATTSSGGSVSTTTPPTPRTGPGSLANVPVPPNVDQLSIAQLIKLLDPSKTPSSEVFKAATEARQKARAAGLSASEVERQVLIATVKASRKPGSDAGSVGNCNQGYQQFNNTYTDGDPLRAALVPDDRIIGQTPLQITEAQHVRTEATNLQDIDMRKKIPLLDVCKKNNSRTKGIQRILKNLINTIEDLKKKFNQVSAFSAKITEFTAKVQEQVFGAIEEISRFAKDTINGIRGYILKQVQDKIKTVAPFLFPGEAVKLDQQLENGISLINCLFNKLIAGLKTLLANILSKLLDNVINVPLCAAENLVGELLNSILGPIASILEKALAPINALISSIAGILSGNIAGFSLFNALEFISGIIKFFTCDDEQECVKYTEISQDGSALPGGDPKPIPSNPQLNSPTGTGQGSSSPVSANTSNSGSSNTFNLPPDTIRSGVVTLTQNSA